MPLPRVERRARWALPPRAPETWVGARWTSPLILALVVSAALCVQPLLDARTARTVALAALTAVSCAGALISAYVLLVQDSVTGERRLRAAACGYGVLVPLLLARSLTFADAPDQPAPAMPVVTALMLLVLPTVVLLTPRGDRSLARLLVPLDVLAVAAFVLLAVPAVARQPVVGGRVTVVVLLLLAAALSLFAAARRSASTYPAPGEAWSWVTLSLVLQAAAALTYVVAPEPWTRRWWAAVVLQHFALVLPALGLALVTSRGYRRQSRRWRQLVGQVGLLRAASPLLPGLSITPEDDEGLPEEPEVRALIDDGRVRVALQPVVALADGSVVGFEALSRFGGRVPTDRWFRGASRCGLGGELERVTLQAALALLPDLSADLFLAVNVSPAALDDAPVLALLHAADLSRVVVEVTEHEAVVDYGATRVVLARLRAAGARIAVDDTGAGFASLRHVLMLQPDIIKLDTSLTRDVQGNVRQGALVKALGTFAREVGSIVIAEGVETEEQLQALRGLAVPWGQGWHLGVPMVVT